MTAHRSCVKQMKHVANYCLIRNVPHLSPYWISCRDWPWLPRRRYSHSCSQCRLYALTETMIPPLRYLLPESLRFPAPQRDNQSLRDWAQLSREIGNISVGQRQNSESLRIIRLVSVILKGSNKDAHTIVMKIRYVFHAILVTIVGVVITIMKTYANCQSWADSSSSRQRSHTHIQFTITEREVPWARTFNGNISAL